MILILGAAGLCALLAEGAAADWSAVYLQDSLGTSAGFAAAGFAAFSLAMAAGRMFGDRLAARFGPVRLVRCGGLVAAVGLAGGLLSGQPAVAVAGFAVLGPACPAWPRRSSWPAARRIQPGQDTASPGSSASATSGWSAAQR